MFVAFWAESSLHHAITSESSNIVNLANSSNVSDTVDIVKTVVLLVEGKRYNNVYCMILYVGSIEISMVGKIKGLLSRQWQREGMQPTYTCT